LLTYDNLRIVDSDPLKSLLDKNIPDQVECGESNDYWIFVNRKTKLIELVSKEHGRIVAYCAVDDAARKYGLSPQQISAARTGLAL